MNNLQLCIPLSVSISTETLIVYLRADLYAPVTKTCFRERVSGRYQEMSDTDINYPRHSPSRAAVVLLLCCCCGAVVPLDQCVVSSVSSVSATGEFYRLSPSLSEPVMKVTPLWPLSRLGESMPRLSTPRLRPWSRVARYKT